MLNLKHDIENTIVASNSLVIFWIGQAGFISNSLVIFWIGQAGFILKTKNNVIITIDPYLSNSAEYLHNFKRLMPIPILPEEILADYVITTHEHVDHCDPDTISVISRSSNTHFIGPKDCVKNFHKFGIDKDFCFKIKGGDTIDFEDIKITGVYADHGKISKDAVGVIVETDGIKVYHTGDKMENLEILILEKLQCSPEMLVLKQQ
jgi:L-ascorbate 6-phosphate lactonase